MKLGRDGLYPDNDCRTQQRHGSAARCDLGVQTSKLNDGRECSQALLAAAFDHLRTREAASSSPDEELDTALMFASVHRHNGRARRVLERNGFAGFVSDPDLNEHLLAVCPVAL